MKILICANSYFSLCGCVVAQHGNLGKEYTAKLLQSFMYASESFFKMDYKNY